MKLLIHDESGYRELTWSKTPPKKPGFYGWYCPKTSQVDVINIRSFKNGKLFIVGWDYSNEMFERDDYYWLGPIPVPSPPQEEE